MNTFHLQTMNAMANMLSKAKKTITSKQYEQFKKEFVFEKLKGKSFGGAFCEKFQISDYLLSNINNDDEAKFLIEKLDYIK